MNTKTNVFNYRREAAQNPWTGFMSFQHFRGEKLYSDIVVRPENGMTETERVECYPVSPDAEENGRNEGYYPDSSVVYIRILWKEFEPERGVYNYQFIQDILDRAKEKEQTLIFRLMAHSTRACDDVPEWLKSLVDCPERPDGKRVKDSPTDPLFIELFLDAVRAIGARFDSDPIFEAIDISLPGSWGEGHNLELYPDDIITRITDVYLEAFPNTQLIAQCRRHEQIEHANKVKPTGWRGDGLGEPHHTFEIYPEHIEAIKDNWKTAPVSFEAFWWLCEWQRKGWDVDAIIEKTLDWHISSFNAKSIPAPFEWQEKIDAWVAKMGYHYTVKSATLPCEIAANEPFSVKLCMENVGVAPIYKEIPLKVRFSCGDHRIESIADVDLRTWLPGEHETEISLSLPFAGEWTVEIAIQKDGMPKIYLATDAKRNDVWYEIGTVKAFPQ